MRRPYLPLVTIPLLAAACGSAADSSTPQPTGTVAAAATAAEGALGMTEAQLLDADIVDASGVELGEVERIVRGSDGKVAGFVIEIEDSNPDRFVQLPLEGLAAVQNGHDWDLRADTTRENLMALPETTL